MSSPIDEILSPFRTFGVNLGLERIKLLLEKLGNPQEKVPIIHVAGSNGKGSVCAYLSSIFTYCGYKTGRYTSPHLVNWTERICINERQIEEKKLEEILEEIIGIVDRNSEKCPTLFEIITAAAWYYFASESVDIAIMEVGLGGRLDATNVCNSPLVSIITSISREHWQVLGDSIAQIAAEKAGIIKKNCPVLAASSIPPEGKEVITGKAKELQAPLWWIQPAVRKDDHHAVYDNIVYKLPLAGDCQLQNSALAIAACKLLKQDYPQLVPETIARGIEKTQWPGRIQWLLWQNTKILVDGAHNVESAKILRQYVNSLHKEILWIIGMLDTKDHAGIFQELLRPHEQLYLVPVPDHASAHPESLATLAKQIQPQLKQIKTYPDLFTALDAIIPHCQPTTQQIVVCGSLYLIGYLLKGC
ncbi:MAG TPA: bifunctional folylpolyglutamate synthase/dihydrofolate synthase [Geminocystis sp. M7585_C2015_104]|nr:bifunctional folylpolyglutamate synthase/dihydrofolate synthase [Geminocystis sp. M7585_C2015_104]